MQRLWLVAVTTTFIHAGCGSGSPVCVANQPCATASPCRAGATACASPSETPLCVETGDVANGVACGTGSVCSGGACVPSICSPNQACQPAAPCHVGATICSGSALATCTTTSDKPDGTSCGNGSVCQGGACLGPGCRAGVACQPANPCALGATACPAPTSTPICNATGVRPDGTSCGAGQACSSGVCVAVAGPGIRSFSAAPATIATGGSAVLSWSVAGADSLSIDQGIGAVTGTARVVSPTATTTYTLTATGAGRSVTASVTVTVASGAALSVARAEPAGASCAWGGKAVRDGIDTNGDGLLQDGEVTQTRFACNPAPTLYARRVEAPGATCPGGGLSIQHGPDLDGNGVLDPGEVAGTNLFCRGTTVVSGGSADAAAYGAAGDGSTDDTLALRSAIAAAGVSGTVFLAPGATYIVSGTLGMLPGQTLWGYGATIRRAPEVKTTTATRIVAGSSPTQIVVADASRFWVGQTIDVMNGVPPAPGSFDPNAHRIASIVGNTLTVEADFTTAFPDGGTVLSAFPMIAADVAVDGTPANVVVAGVDLDGNRAGNPTLQRWEIHPSVSLAGDFTVVRDCLIHDSQSEGILLGGAGSVAERNVIRDSSGNGIHFSGTSSAGCGSFCGGGAVARANVVRNCNLSGSAGDESFVGHADGCIIFSNDTVDSRVEDNFVENGISGVGSIDTVDNSSVVVTGNVIRDCRAYAMEGALSAGATVRDVQFTRNSVFGCQQLAITMDGDSPGNGPQHFTVTDNFFQETAISVLRALDVTVSGNVMFSVGTSGSAVSVASSAAVVVQDNVVTGWDSALLSLP